MSVRPYPPEIPLPGASGPTWLYRLDLAHSAEEVVEAARDFLATLTPYELHDLPGTCQPPHKLFPEDIPGYAFELVCHECSTPQTQELVHKLAGFFSHASTRLSMISADDQADDALEAQRRA